MAMGELVEAWERFNLASVLDVTREQLERIYQGNIFTPLALVRTLLPGMPERGQGTLINMVSYTAFHNPPAPADKGGRGFAYPSSKAAFARMAGALRVEHAGNASHARRVDDGAHDAMEGAQRRQSLGEPGEGPDDHQ